MCTGARPCPYPLPAAVRMRPGSTVSHSFPSRLHFRRLSFRPPPAVTSFSTSMYMEGSELTWGRQDKSSVELASDAGSGADRLPPPSGGSGGVVTGTGAGSGWPLGLHLWSGHAGPELKTEASRSRHPHSGEGTQGHRRPAQRMKCGSRAGGHSLQQLWGVAGAEAGWLLEEIWDAQGAWRACESLLSLQVSVGRQ